MPRDVRRAKEPTRSQLTVKPLAVFTFAFVRDDYLRTMIHVLYTYTYCTRTLGSTFESTTRTLGSTFVLSYFRTFVRKYESTFENTVHVQRCTFVRVGLLYLFRS